MGILNKLQVVKGKSKAAKIFEGLFPNQTFWDIKYNKPSEYVQEY